MPEQTPAPATAQEQPASGDPARDVLTDEQLQQIIAEFSETIFWNNTRPWPQPQHEADLYAFSVRDPAPGCGTPEDYLGEKPILVRFETGELTVPVALFPEQGDDADVGNVTSKADARFVANLPVYVPALLRTIAALRARVAAQPAEGMGSGTPAEARPDPTLYHWCNECGKSFHAPNRESRCPECASPVPAEAPPSPAGGGREDIGVPERAFKVARENAGGRNMRVVQHPAPASGDGSGGLRGLIEAMKWYANPAHYEEGAPQPPFGDGVVLIHEDKGAIARAALAAAKPSAPREADTLAPAAGDAAEVARLTRILERDRTAFTQGLNAIKAEIDARRGMAEGRGSYEWDDDKYRQEFGWALDAIAQKVKAAEEESHAHDLTDCPRGLGCEPEVRLARTPFTEANRPAPAAGDAGRVGEGARKSATAIQISPESGMRRLWHTNCPNWMPESRKGQNTSGIMRYVQPDEFILHDDGGKLYLAECLHCGARGYIGLDKDRVIIVRDAAPARRVTRGPRGRGG